MKACPPDQTTSPSSSVPASVLAFPTLPSHLHSPSTHALCASFYFKPPFPSCWCLFCLFLLLNSLRLRCYSGYDWTLFPLVRWVTSLSLVRRLSRPRTQQCVRQASKSLVEVKRKKNKSSESGININSRGGDLQLAEEELLVCTKCGAAGQTGSVGRMCPLSCCRGWGMTQVSARELESVLKAAHDSALFPVSWRRATTALKL